MALIDNLRPKPFGPPQAPAIAAQLAEARASLAELESRRDAAALDALSGDTGSLDKLNAEVKAAQSSIDLLASAHRGALERDKLEQLRIQKIHLEAAKNSVSNNLGRRDKAADAFATAIAEAQKQYRIMHHHHDQAYHTWTLTGQPWPSGAITETELVRAAQDEGWRNTTGDLAGDKLSLPLPAYSRLEWQFNPAAIPRIDATLGEDTAFIKAQIAKLMAKVAG
jgi:hypothetical protein